MAIEKSLGQAPLGAGEIDDEELEGEVIVVELESDEDDISDLIEEAREMMSFEDNLAEELDDNELETLSGELIGLVEADVDSRKEWADIYVKGLDLIGFKHEKRTEPWQNACGVHSNVLAEAAIRFQAETMSETFEGIIGEMKQPFYIAIGGVVIFHVTLIWAQVTTAQVFKAEKAAEAQESAEESVEVPPPLDSSN